MQTQKLEIEDQPKLQIKISSWRHQLFPYHLLLGTWKRWWWQRQLRFMGYKKKGSECD